MRRHFLAWPFMSVRVQGGGKVVEGKREKTVKSLMFLLIKTLTPLDQGATLIASFTWTTSLLVLSPNSHMVGGLGLLLWIWRGHSSVHSRGHPDYYSFPEAYLTVNKQEVWLPPPEYGTGESSRWLKWKRRGITSLSISLLQISNHNYHDSLQEFTKQFSCFCLHDSSFQAHSLLMYDTRLGFLERRDQGAQAPCWDTH